jgi:hypothetical protein
MGCEKLRIPHYLYNWLIVGGEVVSLTRRWHLTFPPDRSLALISVSLSQPQGRSEAGRIKELKNTITSSGFMKEISFQETNFPVVSTQNLTPSQYCIVRAAVPQDFPSSCVILQRRKIADVTGYWNIVRPPGAYSSSNRNEY